MVFLFLKSKDGLMLEPSVSKEFRTRSVAKQPTSLQASWILFSASSKDPAKLIFTSIITSEPSCFITLLL